MKYIYNVRVIFNQDTKNSGGHKFAKKGDKGAATKEALPFIDNPDKRFHPIMVKLDRKRQAQIVPAGTVDLDET